MKNYRMRLLLLRLSLLLLPLCAQAQDVDCAAIDGATAVAPRDRLNALEQNGCLGGDHDHDALTHEVMGALPDGRATRSPGVSDDERRAATLSALDRVNAAIERQFVELPADAPAAAAERLHRLQQALLIARDDVAAASEHEGLHRPVYWKFDRNSGGFHGASNGGPRIDVEVFAGLLDDACREGAGEKCDQAYRVAKHIVRDAQLVERALTYYASPILDTHYRAAQIRDRQWRGYFDEALFQYPWELFLNGLWIERHDPRPRDAHGKRIGFLSPPTAQWIVFHPSVGFEYLGAAADDNQLEPIVFVELVGYNRWRWNSMGELRNALGFSLIAGYSDRAAADDLAYGLMLHYQNNLALAVTQHGGDTGWLLSTDLARYLGKVSEKTRRLIRYTAR